MNIAIILSGGVGQRFGASTPKQYLNINGIPCIAHVIKASLSAKTIDHIVISMDSKYKNKIDSFIDNKISIVDNGTTRYLSLQNAFNYIKKNFTQCKQIIILDAAAPLIRADIIDSYISKLSTYDAIITAKKITGELANNKNIDEILQRDDYSLMSSPEAYNFNKIYSAFNPDFSCSELAHQLPKGSKKYLCFDFPENIKITYPYELQICEFMKANNY